MSTFAPEVEPSALAMTRLLTLPFRRGGETLEIPLGADGPLGTAIGPFTFGEYRARHGELPSAPRYLIVLRQITGRDSMQIDVDYTFQAAPKTVTLDVPPRSFAGSSFMIPIPANEAAEAVLMRFRVRPVPMPGNRFGMVALLGNLAKLTWVLGSEKDEIRQHIGEVMLQRTTRLARSYSLDRLGEDLGVSRFPAREHSFDDATIALYHFNEVVPLNGVVADETAKFGGPGHPGTNDGATSVPAGKFGGAFRFDGGGIRVASHADFDAAVANDLTVEAYVRADGGGAPRQMIAARGNVAANGDLAAPGWTLSLGADRGFANNIRWSVNGAAGSAVVFADLDVADGTFHHLAGTIDRTTRQARLFLDGRQRGSAEIVNLGAVVNNQPVLIGRSAAGHNFSGVVDEVRFSSAARSDFAPVLGEGDDAYRQRLGIFEQWLLPTPDGLTAAINSRVQIDGDPSSFVLVEKTRPGAGAGTIVRIVPDHLTPGQHIDSAGSLLALEPAAAGTAAADQEFDEVFLVRHDRAGADYGTDETRRRMQARTAAMLDAVLDLIAALNPPVAGNLIVEKAFDPAGPGLHAVGRALRLRHVALGADRLAVLAHRAGFDFVRNDDPTVSASVADGEKLGIVIEPRPPAQTPPAPIDVFTGSAIDVRALPDLLPRVGTFQWSLVPLGPAVAHFVTHPADPALGTTPVSARPRLRVVADAPGEMMLRLEYRYRRRVVTGTRRIRISVETVARTITRDGDLEAPEASASGVFREPIKPMYLVTSNVAGVNYGANPNNRRMHVALERAFNTLIRRNPGLAAGLSVTKAFDPAGPGLHAAGRAIVVTHGATPGIRLAALLHQAGFDFVERQGASAYGSVADDSPIEIVRMPALTPLEPEIVAGTAVNLRARFDVLPGAGSFNWSVERVGHGSGSFDFVLRPQVRFTPRNPGLVSLHLFFHEPDANAMLPYTFEIRLNPQLEAAKAIVSKPQYDLIMNILNYFHPIGVEVLTGRLRAHVVEVEQDPLKAFPAYTYPHFRRT